MAIELQEKWFRQELSDKFSIITDKDVLIDERKYSIADMVDAGFSESKSVEMVDEIIANTRD